MKQTIDQEAMEQEIENRQDRQPLRPVMPPVHLPGHPPDRRVSRPIASMLALTTAYPAPRPSPAAWSTERPGRRLSPNERPDLLNRLAATELRLMRRIARIRAYNKCQRADCYEEATYMQRGLHLVYGKADPLRMCWPHAAARMARQQYGILAPLPADYLDVVAYARERVQQITELLKLPTIPDPKEVTHP